MASGAVSVHPERVQKTMRSRSEKFSVSIHEIVQETRDTVTLVFGYEGEKRIYKAGQFVTIAPQQFAAIEAQCRYLEMKKGKKEAVRAYSLASSPLDDMLAVTVKAENFEVEQNEYPPLLSPYLVYGMKMGQKFEVEGFAGAYCWFEDMAERTDHVVHLCAGSGIVPNYGMIRYALDAEPTIRHTLIYGNKYFKDIIYYRQLMELTAKYPDKLRVVFALSREDSLSSFAGEMQRGRVSLELMQEIVPSFNDVEIFACGAAITKYARKLAKEKGELPMPRFMETIVAACQQLHIPKERLHRESYG